MPNLLFLYVSPQITIETKLTESRDANQLLGKLLRDTQNEKRMLEHRHREQQQKLKETTGQLERQERKCFLIQFDYLQIIQERHEDLFL